MQFEELVKKTSPVLRRITKRLNGRWTFIDDDDLFQEALIYLWQCFKEEKLNEKTNSYILQGCYFYLKNYLRKVSDNVIVVSLNNIIDESKIELGEIISVDNGNLLENKLLVDTIYTSVGLTEREKDVLSLWIEEWTVREIGQKLGISHVMVMKIQNKIRNKCSRLKKELWSGGKRQTIVKKSQNTSYQN
ncbi:MAG: sigma-70 family RNA polymerase sigma factor [Candidatus Firestonebacteria bacterium]